LAHCLYLEFMHTPRRSAEWVSLLIGNKCPLLYSWISHLLVSLRWFCAVIECSRIRYYYWFEMSGRFLYNMRGSWMTHASNERRLLLHGWSHTAAKWRSIIIINSLRKLLIKMAENFCSFICFRHKWLNSVSETETDCGSIF
jgi:hypothetical protein